MTMHNMTHTLQNGWQALARLYQTHRTLVENTLLSAAMTTLVGLILHYEATSTYPSEWLTVLLLATFGLGVRAPAWGYAAAIAVLVWPLWTLSPYLMALFLAVTVLGHMPILDNLPWALLIAAMPLLAQGYLAALAPLAAGVLVGAQQGALVGALAALWMKVFAGMVGLSPDLLTINERAFDAAVLVERFGNANSLETLRLLVAPFAVDSTVLLLHVLQIGAWALAGYLVGRIRQSFLAERSPWLAVGSAIGAGGLTAWAGFYALPIWLGLATPALIRQTPWTTLGTLGAMLLSVALYALLHTLRKPPTPRRVHVRRGWSAHVSQPATESPTPNTAEDEDLIMIELD